MAGTIEARPLQPEERERALEHLARNSRQNLLLLELTAGLGSPQALGEFPTEIVCAWRGDRVVGVAALRPSVIFDSAVSADVLEAFLPYLSSLRVGLVKSAEPIVDLMWKRLSRRRRRHALVDRIEITYALPASGAEASLGAAERKSHGRVRRAEVGDLEPLVIAARESLREENRPDPFSGDIDGFRRWVEGRISRARVVETNGKIGFVGYADVQRPEGWLIQGVYAWPEFRRRGLARAGMVDLCREAFRAGGGHVQLAVVEGNDAGRALYEGLGFQPFGRLRTILFT